VSIKLLFSMFDHATDCGPAVREDRLLVRDDQRTVPDGTAVPRTDPGTVPTVRTSSRTIARPGTDEARPSTITAQLVPGPGGDRAASEAVTRDSVPQEVREVAHLIPAARAAHDALTATGRRLSRDALADRMREDGHGVSNARASLLMKILKAEDAITPLGYTPSAPPGREAGDFPQVAA
jgi:hypothetical protein